MKAGIRRPSWGTVAGIAALVAVAAACFTYADRAAPGKKAEDRLAAAEAEGKSPHWRTVTRVWLPRAAYLNGWLMLGTAALVPWARRSLTAKPPESDDRDDRDERDGRDGAGHGSNEQHEDPPRIRRLGWGAMVVLAGVAAWSTAPRLDQSVWGDEGRTLREFIVGQFLPAEAGGLTFDEATWGDAFFNFRTPNNHVLYSLAARASHLGLSRPPVEAGDAYFSERGMRLPAWLAAVASVFTLAGLGAVVGWRRAGWIAAALLVLHPGFVRYAAEARGYAFLLLFGPLLLIALVRAVQTGRWRWWWLAAALDFALIYTWPMSLFLVVVANAGALGAVVAGRRREARDRLTLVLRWALTVLVATAVWIQLFLPNVIQLRYWLRSESAFKEPGLIGEVNALSLLMTGRVWHDADAANPLLTPWVRTWAAHPALVVLAAALLVSLLAAGVVTAWRRTPALRPWLPALLLPPLIIVGQAALNNSLLYPWYLMGAVPGAMLLLAIGLESSAARLSTRPSVQVAAIGLGIVLFALSGAEARQNLRRHPIEPNREAALLIQPALNPHHPNYQQDVLTAGFLMRNTIYDPGNREFKNADQLRALMEEARRTGRDLVVIYGQRGIALQSFPEITAILDDPSEFVPVATLYGQESYSTRYIVRHPAVK